MTNEQQTTLLILIGILMVLWGTGVGSSQLPSDFITHQNAPHAIDLQHVSPEAVKAIDRSHAELTTFQPRDMADFGHYSASTREEIQGSNETQTDAIKDFVGGEVAPLGNVGNLTGNATEINGTMVWL